MIGEHRQKRGSGIVIEEHTIGDNVTLIAGVDAGSTETRVCLADKDDAKVYADPKQMGVALSLLQRTFIIPSTYANTDDAREISPASDNIEDNYDSIVMLVSNKAEKPMISRHRVLRGRKISDAMGVTQRYMDSSTNKSDNPIFYVNILDALGYAIMLKYNGSIPERVKVHLTVSVRPKELVSKCKQKMLENLLGEFIFCWRSVKIRMNIASLDFTTEPEAQIGGTTTMCDLRAANNIDKAENTELADKLWDSSCYIHIEGGGSSIGVEVIRDGEIVDACSSTFQLGGNYMAQVFIDRYREMQGRTVTKEAANTAILTGILKDGRNTLDVSNLVAHCKDQVAMNIAERLRHEVIDTMADLTLNDVEFISLGGRLFSKDAAGNDIGTFFEGYIHQISPHTEVFSLPENFIAQCNMTSGLSGEYASDLTSVETSKPTTVVTAHKPVEDKSTDQ